MSAPSHSSTSFNPEYSVKMEGSSTANFASRTPLAPLTEWIRANKWRGELRVSFAGNGGISSILFVERTPISVDEYKNSTR